MAKPALSMKPRMVRVAWRSTEGKLGSAAVIDGRPFAVDRPASAFGQHTDEVLSEFGYSTADIEHMRATNVIGGK